MRKLFYAAWLLYAAALAPAVARAQVSPSQNRPTTGNGIQLRFQLAWPHPQKHHATPAVAWLEPLAGTPAAPFVSNEGYTLLQKNRAFVPHLLIVPVGSVVVFPNADPFFHNVFSLFDGKRFDLGLYEAGSSKSVTFSREGVSYIFCNIHPEMSAVVLALSTSLYAVAKDKDSFVLSSVAPGDYKLHIWIEGVPPPVLASLTRQIHLGSNTLDLGQITVPATDPKAQTHTNKFGKPYAPDSKSVY
jgi:plastocyanin